MARIENGVAAAVVLAATLLMGAAPASGVADPRHIVFPGHAPAQAPAAHGPVRLADGPRHDEGGRRFGGDWHRGGGEGHGGGDWHRDRDRGDWHRGDWHRGDGPHFVGRPRYEVPRHWEGMHPDWDDGPRPGYWVRPWGPRWVPHYWGGGYWGGRFWPHVYLGWDFPWFMATLPIGYSTYWWGNVPYYYWQGVYYVWSPDYGAYVVADPPPLGGPAPAATAPPPSPAAANDGDGRGAMSLYVYPKQGQSEQQTENDRYQCHEWAVGQTGFDPSNTANSTQAATATPENYKRAVTACLQARGYSVR